MEGAGTSSTKIDIKNRKKDLHQRAESPHSLELLADINLPSTRQMVPVCRIEKCKSVEHMYELGTLSKDFGEAL